MRIIEGDVHARIDRMLIGQEADNGPNGLKKGEKVTADYMAGSGSRATLPDLHGG